MKMRSLRSPVLVAGAVTLLAGAVFWRDVWRIRRGMSTTGSGGIAAVAAPKTAFPVALLAQTSLLGFPQAGASTARLPQPRIPAPDLLGGSHRLIRVAENIRAIVLVAIRPAFLNRFGAARS